MSVSKNHPVFWHKQGLNKGKGTAFIKQFSGVKCHMQVIEGGILPDNFED